MTVLHVGPFTPRHRSTDWRIVVWDAVSMAELAFASWAAAYYVDTGSVLAAVATGVLVADGGVRLRRMSKFADAKPAASAAPGSHPPDCPGHTFADTVPVPVSATPGGGVLSARRPTTRGPLASGRGSTAAVDAPKGLGAVPGSFPVVAAGPNARVDNGSGPVTFPQRVAGRSVLDVESRDRGCGACPPAHPSPVAALGGQADRTARAPQPRLPSHLRVGALAALHPTTRPARTASRGATAGGPAD